MEAEEGDLDLDRVRDGGSIAQDYVERSREQVDTCPIYPASYLFQIL